MKIKTMLGLGAVGGLLYLHKKNGGEWTLDSFKDSFRQVWDGIRSRAEQVRESAQEKIEQGIHTAGEAAQDFGGSLRQY
jgi:hypothetical protein